MNKHRKARLSGLVTLILPILVYAQGQAAPAAPVPANPATTAVQAAPVTVTPEMRVAIKELLEISRFRDNLRQSYQSFEQNLPAQMAQVMNKAIQQNTQLSEDQKRQVRERLGKSFEAAAKAGIAVLKDPKLVDEMSEKIYPIYAQHFTLNEIRQINAFYKTQAGAKLISTMPLVMSDTMRTAMTILQPRISPIIDNALKKEIEAVQQGK